MKEYKTLDPSIKKFRLGIFAGDLNQPISMMRHLGPFAAMAKEDPRLELVFPPLIEGHYQIGWTWLCQCDAVFYSHPSTDRDLSVLWLAQQMGVPVWSEYVDDLFSVQPGNPSYQNVKNKRQLKELVTQAIQFSAYVTAVSQICADAYPFSERIAVIPEACHWPQNNFPRRKAVSWRGMGSHDQDTDSVLDAVCAVAKDFPDWEWTLLGQPNEDLVDRLTAAAGRQPAAGYGEEGKSRVEVAPFFSTPWHMITAWGYRAPFLHIVPLADNAFNRSKSHLAWLEASAIGAAAIVPDYLPEWQQPGVIPYSGGSIAFASKEDFETVLRREMAGFKVNGDGVEPIPTDAGGPRGDFHPNVQTARAAIYPARTQPAINQLRWQILRKLSGMLPRRQGADSHVGEQRAVSPNNPETFVSRSQIGQDRFVYELLVKPEGLLTGTFLDIGSHTPMEINNTFALEQLGWRGLLIDLQEYPFTAARKSPFIQADATKINWSAQLANIGLYGAVIDYVSLDVDEAQLDALRNLLESGVRCRVATVEHDGYRFGKDRVEALRALMQEHGYTLLAADVCLNEKGIPFEDWYVDATKVDMKLAQQFRSSGKAWQDLFLPTQASKPEGEAIPAQCDYE